MECFPNRVQSLPYLGNALCCMFRVDYVDMAARMKKTLREERMIRRIGV